MLDWIADPDAWLALGSLAILEVVLGIDNIVFLSVVIAKLPPSQQSSARCVGLFGAMVIRLGLLAAIAWVSHLVKALFYLLEHPISARDLILFFGGLFLIWKSCREIMELFHGSSGGEGSAVQSYLGAITQIIMLDIILSLDSIITAVGLSSHLCIMMAAVIIAVTIMLFAARPIGEFVDRHPSVKMLALAFLILIGSALILESATIDVPKEYIYFAMFFSLAVETLNLLRNKKAGQRPSGPDA
ncbi:MAG: hypothetical protein GPOALKHO_001940 [Sodalis sp.]|uniref:TerC family protein n=1 Tax=Sodalis sp. (in: enterobacteria) TaxID=1898979 RepID=UPI003873B046|nr:MAG: hypothetical protein GPOALKHO_001940 [Sodalis sp.]